MLIKILFHLIFLITLATCDYRSINGEGNNRNFPSDGVPNTPLIREALPNMLYGDAATFQMVPTPGNYATDPKVSCADPVPVGNYPLPRCVSDVITAMRLKDTDSFDLDRLDKFKSKRKNSHILTYWAFFIRMDIVSAPSRGEIFPQGIYIPTDDASYLSSYRNGPAASTFAYTVPFLSLNRSVADGNHTGLNTVTTFLDASTIYGNSEADLQVLRDFSNNGKMKLSTFPTPDGQFGYPRTDPDGNLIIGIKASTRNVFTDLFTTIFLREHNRLCDELYAVHKDSWDDEKYFQEARRWVIAFIQKITFYEYLGTALGAPLPPYTGYRPDLRPLIDTFFATVTFRYGHSEISDFYNIVNDHGDYLATLSLHDLKEKGILPIYGVPSLALSLALQLQEEVDIYFSENMRSYHAKLRSPDPAMDIAALDVTRARDHGIPSYNDARVAFNLKRKESFEEITSDPEVQQKLKATYATVDQIEPLMGALAETHVGGGNYGELISESFKATWSRIRDSDRFWYENKEASGFSSDDISKIQTTRLVDIIRRNTPKSSAFPDDLWFVRPPALSTSLNSNNYGYGVSLADGFNLQWKIEGSDVVFLITVSSINTWFGIGFNPNGAAMKDTDMMIFWNNEDSSSVVAKNYKGVDRAVRPRELPPDDQIITLLGGTNVANGITTVEVRRPLNAKNRKSLNNQIEMVYAWNFNSKVLTYHGGNRGTKMINLLTGESSGFADARQKNLLLMHGIIMFIIWGILFPGSVWIVRYLRHIDSYMSQHRNLNLIGGTVVAAFGAVAMSVIEVQASSPHGIMGIIVFAITGVQIALGILAIWALANVESAATGIVCYLKHLHFYLGGALLLAAWANIYLGMIQFDTRFNGNGANKPYIWAYTAWLVMFGFIITASEFYYRIRNMQFLWPVKPTDDMSRRIRDCIPDKVYEHLPSITWNEFNQRVMTGASLVIAEGLVFDVHRWIPIHPGGQRILKRVIGTDITNDFFFDPSVVTVINRNFENEYDEKTSTSISVLTDNLYREKTINKDGTSKPYSVANAVDMINATAFRDKRVAMHRHSKFATSKLATMVVARIIDPVEESSSMNAPSTRSPKQPKLNTLDMNNDLNEQQPLSYPPNIFRRYILSNIETVSRSDAERPVKKFTFQVIHPKDRLPKFLPGDYIEIMSEANNHVVIRPYTPLQGPTENSFCILVKIYKDGAMSQHLNKQLRNFEIKVRGPFDIADRMIHVSSPSLKPASIHSRPTSPSSPNATGSDKFSAIYSDKRSDIKQRSQYGGSMRGGPSLYSFGDSNIQSGFNLNNFDHLLDGRSGILLNKEREDLCWDHLFMVCGGTGITPMLQMIQYHMDKAATLGSKFNLYLLNANDTIADLIQPQYLDYLCTVLKGKLRITYILSKPPPIWKGLSGHIDDSLLFDWIHQNYSVPPPAIPPRLSNYSTAGGSMISTSTVTNQPPPRSKNYGKGPVSEYDEYEEIIEPSRQQQQQQQPRRQYNEEELYDPQRRSRMPPPSPLQIPVETQTSPSDPHLSFNSQNLPYYFSPSNYHPQHTNEMILLNERYNYMRSLAADNTNQVKLVVCGTSRFNDNIRKSLEKLGFPIEEKALFIS